jgi:energy-coupling factor transport system ATP-binding protein
MLTGGSLGQVKINGLNTVDHPVREMAKTVGMVFDNPEFQITQMTVQEEVALGLENLGVPRREMVERIRNVLSLVGLSGFEDRNPMTLSGGQQQRLGIASAIVMEPSILVLDEPTSNLDPVGKQEVFHLARRLNQEHGMTIVIAEHEVEVLAQYADHIVVLNEGKIILSGSPKEVFCQVNLHHSIGLRVPQVTEFIYEAHQQRGATLNRENIPIVLEEAESLLLSLLKAHCEES